MKIMFHIFRVLPPGFSQNFFKSQSLYLWRWQLEKWQLAPRFARCIANSLYLKEEEAWNFSKSQGLYKGGEIGIFPSPRNYMKAVLGTFLSPKAHTDMGVPNPIYRRISSTSFLFSTYFFIFLYIFHIFLHIYYIKEFPNVTSSGGWRGNVLANPYIKVNDQMMDTLSQVVDTSCFNYFQGIWKL